MSKDINFAIIEKNESSIKAYQKMKVLTLSIHLNHYLCIFSKPTKFSSRTSISLITGLSEGLNFVKLFVKEH